MQSGTALPQYPEYAHADHVAQFYESDEFLAATVGDHIADGLGAGQAVVVIATQAHRDAFTARLLERGVDADRAARAGRLTLLDARGTLATFMDGDSPSPVKFRQSLGDVVARSVRVGGAAGVRAYGEMVDLLWRDGNDLGALRLETLWNELAHAHHFSLLCAYSMANFERAADAERFRLVCGQHARVLPTERYRHDDEAARMREVSELQQRARALETELAHRLVLEQGLRDALAAHAAAEDALLRGAAERERLLEAERAARRAAEDANEAKRRFLATMSHELRTPLNAIAGHVQLVELGLHGPVTEAQREALGRASRAQRHLLRLISDVLDYARIESGRLTYQMRAVSLSELIADVLPLVETQAAEGGVTLVAPVARATAADVAWADCDKLAQILVNLLSNAVKFTAAGGRVTVEVTDRDDESAPEGVVFVRVSDTGIGIPRHSLESVFEPFVQGDRSYTRSTGGAGLGLSISRDLARGMGGDVRARSEPGVGSSFTVALLRPPTHGERGTGKGEREG